MTFPRVLLILAVTGKSRGGMESTMNKTDREKLKKVLMNQLKELQTDVNKEVPSLETNSPLPDINDQASLESERSFELRIKDRERKLISKVYEALKKMEEGTYGICESCGEAISVKRLMARPVTTLCINCKAEMEAEERREETILQTGGAANQMT